MTLKEIVEQLELCKFACEGGPLENNAAFIELKKIVELLLNLETPRIGVPRND